MKIIFMGVCVCVRFTKHSILFAFGSCMQKSSLHVSDPFSGSNLIQHIAVYVHFIAFCVKTSTNLQNAQYHSHSSNSSTLSHIRSDVLVSLYVEKGTLFL